jgi:hypothetical protein
MLCFLDWAGRCGTRRAAYLLPGPPYRYVRVRVAANKPLTVADNADPDAEMNEIGIRMSNIEGKLAKGNI